MFKVMWDVNNEYGGVDCFQTRGMNAEKARAWAKELTINGDEGKKAWKVKAVQMTEDEIADYRAEIYEAEQALIEAQSEHEAENAWLRKIEEDAFWQAEIDRRHGM